MTLEPSHPTRHRPLRLGVLCSRRAPGLAHLVTHPEHRHLFEVTVCLGSEDHLPEGELLRQHDIPGVARSLRGRVAEAGGGLRDQQARRAYDMTSVRLLQSYGVEMVLLDGYAYILSDALLAAFPGQVFGVHPGDLTRRRADGSPQYSGLRAVEAALAAGERELRVTLHLVTQQVDAGPPVLLSWPISVSPQVVALQRGGARPAALLPQAAVLESGLMDRACGPLLAAAATLVASRRLAVRADRVFVDGLPAPLELTRAGVLRGLDEADPAAAAAVGVAVRIPT